MGKSVKQLRDEILAFGDELPQAQERAASEAKRSRIGQIGTDLISATSGYKPQGDYWGDVAKQGRQGVADVAAKQQGAVQQYGLAKNFEADDAAAAALAAENDPNSEASKFGRDFYGKYGKVRETMGADFDRLTAAQMKKLPLGKLMEEDFKANESSRKHTESLDAESRADKRFYQHNNVTSAQADARAKVQADAVYGKGVVDDTKDLSHKLPPGAGGFYEQLKTIRGVMAESPPTDIPGVGAVDSRKPDWGQSPQGFKLQKAANQMMLAFQNLVTGTGGSNEEMEKIRAAGAKLSNEASFAAGLDELERGYTARLKQTYAGYRPEVVKQFTDRAPDLAVQEPGAAAPQTKSTSDGAQWRLVGPNPSNPEDWEQVQ